MKRIICMLMCLTILAAASGCGKSSGTSESTVNQPTAIGAGIPAETETIGEKETEGNLLLPTDSASTLPEPETEAGEAAAPTSGTGIDVDLTLLSSTMVYSQVYNMMTSPEEYIGKTVRMCGFYLPYCDERTGNQYFTCIIQDATACCAQGIEFVLTEDYRYPDDYPEEGSQITVVGVFDTYLEDNFMYYTLRSAFLES